MSDLRRDTFVTRLLRLDAEHAARIDELLAEMTEAALAEYAREGIDAAQVRFLRYGNLRYENQEHGVEVPLPEGPVDAEEVAASFHELYEREYTYRLDAPVEFVGAHLVAIAEVGKLEPAVVPRTGRDLDDARKGMRTVDYATEGSHEAHIYDGDLLEPHMTFTGPAVVETKGTTVVVHPGNTVTVDDYGNLVIDLAEEGS
jgi:N-methylhydantoinase A